MARTEVALAPELACHHCLEREWLATAQRWVRSRDAVAYGAAEQARARQLVDTYIYITPIPRPRPGVSMSLVHQRTGRDASVVALRRESV